MTERPSFTQPTFADLGTPLREVTFVVVDLETTGGSPDTCAITEVGAVRSRGGEVLGEFATLVNPGTSIPPFITTLTGITEAMVAPAPPIEAVLPALLEFLSGAVLVAHNAPFDIGFLKAACARHGYPWPAARVLDTAAMSRRLLGRDEVPNHKLATLSRYLRASAEPTHRALDDARATLDVLHALIGRLGGHQVSTLEEATEFVRALTPAQRGKRHLAAGLPDAPGVYIFRDRGDRPLYVGTSTSVATRVRSYFTAAEKRRRVFEMLHLAERVEAIECAHSLEAQVRELRLLAALKPPYNRRSTRPERAIWLKLTTETYPRLSLVRQVGADGASYLGPFGSRASAQLVVDAVHDVVPLRQCTTRLSAHRPSPACALAELGRCPAPCQLLITPDAYAAQTAAFTSATAGDPGPLVAALLARIEALSVRQRYEDATAVRARLVALLRATMRTQRLVALTRIAQLVAARPRSRGGWEIAVVRHGRLVAAATSAPGGDPRVTLTALLATAETVRPGPGPAPCATVEETEQVAAWLERPEVRLVEASDGWAYPTGAAARFSALLAQAQAAPAAADPLATSERGRRLAGRPPAWPPTPTGPVPSAGDVPFTNGVYPSGG